MIPSDPNQVGHNQAKDEDRVPILMEEVDSIQVFEDHDTRGDERYPPIQRPPVFPRVFAPPAPNQST
jgi:hypothetical protein